MHYLNLGLSGIATLIFIILFINSRHISAQITQYAGSKGGAGGAGGSSVSGNAGGGGGGGGAGPAVTLVTPGLNPAKISFYKVLAFIGIIISVIGDLFNILKILEVIQ